MAVEVFMPKMSDHMEAGIIIGWLAKEGRPSREGPTYSRSRDRQSCRGAGGI